MLFDTQLSIAADLVVRSRIFLDIWWLYRGKPNRTEFLPAMNEFPEFFRFDTHAHFVAFIVHIAALYERKDDTISIPTIVRRCEREGLVQASVLDELKPLLQQAKGLAKAPTIIRHKAIAHRSAELDYEGVFKIARAKPDDFRALTDISLSIVNRLLLARGIQDRFFWRPAPESARSMLKRLMPTAL